MVLSAIRFFCLLSAGALTACFYKVPITMDPTEPCDNRMIGRWVHGVKDPSFLEMRKQDRDTYSFSLSQVSPFNNKRVESSGIAYHSTLVTDAGIKYSFVSAAVKDKESRERPWSYYLMELSPDGESLAIVQVDEKLVLLETESSEEVQAQLKAMYYSGEKKDSIWRKMK